MFPVLRGVLKMVNNEVNVLFIGSGDIGIQCLEAIESQDSNSVVGVVTYEDDILAEQVITEDIFQLHTTNNIKKYVKWMLKDWGDVGCAYDYFVIAGVNVEFGSKIIDRIRGIVKIHESLLPAYYGSDPLVWAMLNREKRTGVSLVFQDSDNEYIVDQHGFGIEKSDYISDLMVKSADAAARLLTKHYCDIINGCVELQQVLGSTGICYPIRPENGVIDWNRPASDIYDFIRAHAQPYSMAFSYFPTALGIPFRIPINRSSVCDMQYMGTPGEIITKGDDVMVICGDHHAILIEEALLSGNLIKPTPKMKYRVLD